jgi:hypothetical protein
VGEHLGQRDDGYAQRVFLLIVTNRPLATCAKLVVKTPARRGVVGDLVHVAEDALDPFLQEKPTDNDGRHDCRSPCTTGA